MTKFFIKIKNLVLSVNSKIKWHHLLNQSSEWSCSLFGAYDWADRPPNNLNLEEIKKQILFEPGKNYKYNDVRVNLLSYSRIDGLQVTRNKNNKYHKLLCCLTFL